MAEPGSARAAPPAPYHALWYADRARDDMDPQAFAGQVTSDRVCIGWPARARAFAYSLTREAAHWLKNRCKKRLCRKYNLAVYEQRCELRGVLRFSK